MLPEAGDLAQNCPLQRMMQEAGKNNVEKAHVALLSVMRPHYSRGEHIYVTMWNFLCIRD